MKISSQASDDMVLSELGERLAATRLDRNLTQEDIAHESGVSKRTIERIESGQAVQTPNLIRVLRAMALLDRIEQLIPPVNPSPIEQLKLKKTRRHRASSSRTQSSSASKKKSWKWGDER